MKLDVSRAIQGVAAGGGAAISAGANSQNTGTVNFSNSNGVSFGLSNNGVMTASHNGLTTAAQSNHSHGNPTLALTNLSGTTASASNGFTLSLSAANPGAGGGIAAAAGTQTGTSGTIVFSNSNGITFGMSNSSVITASHNGLTTAMASNRGTDFVQATAAFDGTNASGTIASNGISVSVGNYITTAMASNRGTDFVQATAAFNGTNASGTIASNGISISVAAPGGGAGATESFYENVPLIHGTQTFNAVSSTMYIHPFNLDINVSAGFIRLPFSCFVPATTGGVPVANSTITGQMGFTHAFVIYTQGTGVNANSLQYFTSTSGTGSFGTTIGAGANSSQQTVTVNGSFGQSGNQTNLGTGASYGVSSGSYVINSSALSNFTGPRFVDIPFAQSLSPGNYWLGIGRSWSSANNSTIFNGVNPLSSNIFISQSNITWGLMGSATNTSNIMRVPGAGFFTTNASLISTNSINAVGQISVTTSNLVPYFQLIRKA